MKMKDRPHWYDINSRYKYGRYRKCLTMMMLLSIKHHLNNIWSSIHEKVKQNKGWVEKSVYHDTYYFLIKGFFPFTTF